MAKRRRNAQDPGDLPRRRLTLLERLRALHETKPQYLAESLAPEVDLDLLRRLVRKKLSAQDAKLTYELIHAFRTWDEAHSRVIVEQARRRPT